MRKEVGSMEVWCPEMQISPSQQSWTVPRSNSYEDVFKRNSLISVMEEFEMNGSEAPLDPDEDKIWKYSQPLSGMGPPRDFLRQASWPESKRSPEPLLPTSPPAISRPAPTRWQDWPNTTQRARPSSLATGLDSLSELARELAALAAPPAERMEWQEPAAMAVEPERAAFSPVAASTPATESAIPDALMALASLPVTVLYAILRDLQTEPRPRPSKKRLPEECRFCKNNGERESYYRSHVLKDCSGRVECPVLRAFVCRRCGASGDLAHTIKYCPLSTERERNQSAAMMRSVRLASGRRRPPAPAHPAPASWGQLPLEPEWAALEQKLML